MSNRINYNSIPQNGLVLDMPLNGNANARVGADGSPANMIWIDSEKGYTSKVGSFNGTSSWINTSEAPYLANSQRTIHFIITPQGFNTGINNENTIISYSNGTQWSMQAHFNANGTPSKNILAVDYNGGALFSNTLFNIGQTYIITIINNTNLTQLYVNGILDNSIAVGNGINSINMRIGTYNIFGRYFNGQIGLVKIYNRALSTEEIHNLKLEGDRLFGDKPNYPQLLRGLKAYYDFKGGSLSNLVDGTNATNNGATLTTDHLGRANNAYSFNGVSSYMTTPTNYGINGGQFTMSCTVKINSIINGQISCFVSSSSAVSGNQINIIYIYTGGVYYIQFQRTKGNIGGQGYDIVSNTPILNIGQSYCITMTYDGITIKGYIDGIFKGSGLASGNGSGYGNDTRIGSITSSNNMFLNGTISQVIIQNQALNSSEVKELYNLTSKEYIYPFSKSSILSLQKGLVMHLDSNGVDLSGNGNNGTPTAVTPTRRGQSEGGIYNGSSSYMKTSFISPSLFTMSVIIQTTQTTRAGIIRGEDWLQPSSVPGIFLEIGPTTPGILNYSVHDGTNFTSIDSLNSVNDGQAHLITITKEASNLYKLYVDLVLQGTSTVNVGLVSKPIFLGVWPDAPRFFFNGNIYSPKIRNIALTKKQVEAEYYLNYLQ